MRFDLLVLRLHGAHNRSGIESQYSTVLLSNAKVVNPLGGNFYFFRPRFDLDNAENDQIDAVKKYTPSFFAEACFDAIP